MPDSNATPQKRKMGRADTNFSGLPLKALLGAPLKAASDANAMLARNQVQFLLGTCFEEVVKDDKTVLRPRMVKFTLERQVIGADGQPKAPVEMDLQIPLMTLVPLSSLSVDEVNISFKVDIKSSTEFTAERRENRENSAKGKLTGYDSDQFYCELHGTLASDKSSSSKNSTSASYEVKLHAGHLPLPTGITTVLEMFNKSIAPIQSNDN